jgi:hypothetical protein
VVAAPAWSLPFKGLPKRIESHSGEEWTFPAHHLIESWLRLDLEVLDVHFFLANGRSLIVPVDTSRVDDLDPENLFWEPDYRVDYNADH